MSPFVSFLESNKECIQLAVLVGLISALATRGVCRASPLDPSMISLTKLVHTKTPQNATRFYLVLFCSFFSPD